MRNTDNTTKIERTKRNKARRLARKLKDMERKRLKDGFDKFHYSINDGNIIKVKNGI